MISRAIALFGEAEKGNFQTAYLCRSLPQILECLGNPPPDSKGVHLAVQSILYDWEVLFFRVQEEGFSHQDYYDGLDILQSQKVIPQFAGICVPGVGDSRIIDAIVPVCLEHHSVLMVTESDLYDYLFSRP